MITNKVLTSMLEEFSNKLNVGEITPQKLFEYFTNYTIITKFHPEAFDDFADLKYIDVDEGSMFGIDGIAFIVNGNLVLSKVDIETYAKSKNLDVKILFIQSKTEDKFDSGSILKTIAAVRSFFGDGSLLEKNNNIASCFEIWNELCQYKNAKFFNGRSPEVLIYYVAAAKSCEDELILKLCDSQQSDLQSSINEVKFIKIQAAGSDFLIDSYNEYENRIEVNINFKNNLSLDRIEKVEQSYLGYLGGEEFLKIIMDREGSLRRRLFYENVRDFQGNNNDVNKEIQATLAAPELRDKFILLNNGITIVAKHFQSLGSNTYEMRDFQIVNGCQTSTEIYLNRRWAQEILVPIKIIHTTDLDLIYRIVRSTNRQTPVPEEAFITLEKYHKRLQSTFEAYSSDMPVQIFYERRSREFQFLERGLASHQIISLHGLIRAITAVYFRDAYVVYNNNPVNILRNRANKLFNDEFKPEIYYLSNYLISLIARYKHLGKVSEADYTNRYYIAMVLKMLLAEDVTEKPFNSKYVETEAIKVINRLKRDDASIQALVIEARDIVAKALRANLQKSGNRNAKIILQSQGFNQEIISLTGLRVQQLKTSK